MTPAQRAGYVTRMIFHATICAKAVTTGEQPPRRLAASPATADAWRSLAAASIIMTQSI